MKSRTVIRAWSLVAIAAGASTALVFSNPLQQEQIDAQQLKTMIEGLGYETKPINSQPGKEKWQFQVTKGGLEIYIAAELSSSKNYVWLTVYLGDVPTLPVSPTRFPDMLVSNSETQPTHFYITQDNKVLLGFAMENRYLTPSVLRRTVDKLASDTVDTKSLWKFD